MLARCRCGVELWDGKEWNANTVCGVVWRITLFAYPHTCGWAESSLFCGRFSTPASGVSGHELNMDKGLLLGLVLLQMYYNIGKGRHLLLYRMQAKRKNKCTSKCIRTSHTYRLWVLSCMQLHAITSRDLYHDILLVYDNFTIGLSNHVAIYRYSYTKRLLLEALSLLINPYLAFNPYVP